MWTIEVQTPSGEKISKSAKKLSLTVGKSPDADLRLRDSDSPDIAFTLSERKDEINLRSETGVWMGDVFAHHALFTPDIPIRVGNSVIRVREKKTGLELPEQPPKATHWLTQCASGKDILWLAKKAASSPLAIFLSGETGTGKDVLAQLIHEWSHRADRPFVPLHCGALPLSLVESELFGHVKGAFTGAVRSRPGALLQAHGGTLFLDEVGDLPMDVQVKLLRFLENGEIRPVGTESVSHADVRIICATHKDLSQMVKEGKFREDLFFRIASLQIKIPALRDRPQDIELLAQIFSGRLNKSITLQGIRELKAYSWPGNVRELRHAVDRACGVAGPFQTVLREDDFEFLKEAIEVEKIASTEVVDHVLQLKDMERLMLLKALKLSGGNRAEAAKMLGIARSTIFEMLKRHRINGPRHLIAA